MIETVKDYFKLLQQEGIDISRSKTYEANYKVLKDKLPGYQKKKSQNAIIVTMIIGQAMGCWKDKTKYENYLKRLDESSKPEPEPESTPTGESSTGSFETGGKSWKELLFGAAVDIAKAYVESKSSKPDSNREGSSPGLERSRTVSLTGTWVAGDGLPVRFNQRGNQLTFTGVNQFGVTVVQGTGTVIGYQAQLFFRYFDGIVYDEARTDMRISVDGRRMEGMVYFTRSGASSMMGLFKQF